MKENNVKINLELIRSVLKYAYPMHDDVKAKVVVEINDVFELGDEGKNFIRFLTIEGADREPKIFNSAYAAQHWVDTYKVLAAEKYFVVKA